MRSCPNRLPVRSWAHLMKLAPLLAIALATGCSTASHPVSTAEKVAHGTVTLAGKAATSATGTAVQVTKAGVAAAGKVASATTGAVAKVAKTPFVILKEPASGKTKQIPWAQGLTVARARQLAGMTTRAATFQVRRGKEILKANSQLLLQPGDVLERLTSTVRAGPL